MNDPTANMLHYISDVISSTAAITKRDKAQGKWSSVLEMGLWERIFPAKTEFHVFHNEINVADLVEKNYNY